VLDDDCLFFGYFRDFNLLFIIGKILNFYSSYFALPKQFVTKISLTIISI